MLIKRLDIKCYYFFVQVLFKLGLIKESDIMQMEPENRVSCWICSFWRNKYNTTIKNIFNELNKNGNNMMSFVSSQRWALPIQLPPPSFVVNFLLKRLLLLIFLSDFDQTWCILSSGQCVEFWSDRTFDPGAPGVALKRRSRLNFKTLLLLQILAFK